MNCLKYAYKCAGEEIRKACGFLLFEAQARLSHASLRVKQRACTHTVVSQGCCSEACRTRLCRAIELVLAELWDQMPGWAVFCKVVNFSNVFAPLRKIGAHRSRGQVLRIGSLHSWWPLCGDSMDSRYPHMPSAAPCTNIVRYTALRCPLTLSFGV